MSSSPGSRLLRFGDPSVELLESMEGEGEGECLRRRALNFSRTATFAPREARASGAREGSKVGICLSRKRVTRLGCSVYRLIGG
jgi:hypothetical protein